MHPSLCRGAWGGISLVLLASLLSSPVWAEPAGGDFLSAPSWNTPEPDALVAQLEEWVASQPFSATEEREILSRASSLLGEPSLNTDRLDVLAQVFALSDPEVAALVEHCQGATAPLVQPEFSWLASEGTPPFVRNNMQLFYARWLLEAGLYDESLQWTQDLTTDDVAAPATLLFCRAVAHHFLVHPSDSEFNAERLLEREDELPVRYQQLARLMTKDAQVLKDDSLDHIARRMADIQRRLAKGRAGDTVQGIERGVIESLDKMIEELEQMQQQQMAQQNMPSGLPGSTPMEDSKLAELKAPGKVDQRDVGDGADWGDLPPKEREQALQQIDREFSPHYRDVIQQYFRELANEPSGPSQ